MIETPSTPKPEEKSPPPPALPHTPAKALTSGYLRLINLVVLGLIGYAALAYFSDGYLVPDPQQPVTLPAKDAKTTNVVHAADPRIERLRAQEKFNFLTQLFPAARPGVTAVTLKAGEGRQAFCGQRVTYRLREDVNSAGAVSPKRNLTLGRELGDSLGLAWGIEGMRVGEIREIMIPRSFATQSALMKQSKDAVEKRYVELLALAPKLPQAGAMPLKRFTQTGEAGLKLRCGEQAIVHMNLWNAQGKLLFSSLDGLPIYFELGGGKGVPYGLELAVQEMGPGGVYGIILPPELVAPLHPKKPQEAPPEALEVRAFPSDIVFTPGEVLIVDLQFPKVLPLKTAEEEPLPVADKIP